VAVREPGPAPGADTKKGPQLAAHGGASRVSSASGNEPTAPADASASSPGPGRPSTRPGGGGGLEAAGVGVGGGASARCSSWAMAAHCPSTAQEEAARMSGPREADVRTCGPRKDTLLAPCTRAARLSHSTSHGLLWRRCMANLQRVCVGLGGQVSHARGEQVGRRGEQRGLGEGQR
jgi:hypothetical protein